MTPAAFHLAPLRNCANASLAMVLKQEAFAPHTPRDVVFLAVLRACAVLAAARATAACFPEMSADQLPLPGSGAQMASRLRLRPVLHQRDPTAVSRCHGHPGTVRVSKLVSAQISSYIYSPAGNDGQIRLVRDLCDLDDLGSRVALPSCCSPTEIAVWRQYVHDSGPNGRPACRHHWTYTLCLNTTQSVTTQPHRQTERQECKWRFISLS